MSGVEGEEDDVVELEKSNVLLMGPTGSGTFRDYRLVNLL